jgi:putative transposase
LVPGGTFYFTVTSYQRRPILTEADVRIALRESIEKVRQTLPFTIDVIVLLPDHLHTIWTLPEADADFSTRWRVIKQYTTKRLRGLSVAATRLSRSRRKRGEQGIWQQRFWEHAVRDEQEYQALCDYIYYNPVKHGHASCPHAWAYSSFSRFVRARTYALDWQCVCRNLPGRVKEIDVSEHILGE